MGWWITLGILLLLCWMPLGAGVHYGEDGITVKVILGFLRIKVFPLPKWLKRGKKEKKPKADKQKEKPKAKKEKTAEPKKDKGGSLKDFLPFVRLAVDLLQTFRRKLRINRLDLQLIMAGDDPCDLALNYGRAWSAVGNVIAMLERVFVIKERDVEVECDFTSDTTRVTADVALTITLGRILGIAVIFGFRALKEFIKFKKKRKKAVQTR